MTTKDPIFEAIERHRAAFRATDKLLKRRRRASEQAWQLVHAQENRAAWKLATTAPRTVVGLLALTSYALRDDDWPADRRRGCSWTDHLHETLASAAGVMAGRA